MPVEMIYMLCEADTVNDLDGIPAPIISLKWDHPDTDMSECWGWRIIQWYTEFVHYNANKHRPFDAVEARYNIECIVDSLLVRTFEPEL